MTRTIDATMALNALRAVTRRHPKHWNERLPTKDGTYSFAYFNPETGSPSCLIGCALHVLGIQARQVASVNQGVGIRAAAPAIEGYTFTEGALRVLQKAQSAGDAGLAWGDAYDRAEREHEQVSRREPDIKPAEVSVPKLNDNGNHVTIATIQAVADLLSDEGENPEFDSAVVQTLSLILGIDGDSNEGVLAMLRAIKGTS